MHPHYKPWYDDTLFTIDDFDFTIGDGIGTTIAIIILSTCAFCISSYYAIKNRKVIVDEAKKVKDSIRNTSIKIKTAMMPASASKVVQDDSDDDHRFGK